MKPIRSKHLLNMYTPNEKLGTVPECDEEPDERPTTLLSLLALATAFLLLVAAGAVHYTSQPSARLYRADQFGFVHPVHPAHAYKWEREYKILPTGGARAAAAEAGTMPLTGDIGLGAVAPGPGLRVQPQADVELDADEILDGPGHEALPRPKREARGR